ncbi:unnamed protein product [Penicillium pancosmium]
MKIFSTNCTLPPEDTVKFVKSPNTRGTLDIICSCLSVILICTWSILHLNVPIQPSPRNWKQKFFRALYRTSRKGFWMVVDILSPEWAFAKAFSDYRAVSAVKSDFDNSEKKQDTPWSRSHIYFADMGGFTVKFDESTAAEPLQDEGNRDTKDPGLYRFIVNVESFALDRPD